MALGAVVRCSSRSCGGGRFAVAGGARVGFGGGQIRRTRLLGVETHVTIRSSKQSNRSSVMSRRRLLCRGRAVCGHRWWSLESAPGAERARQQTRDRVPSRDLGLEL